MSTAPRFLVALVVGIVSFARLANASGAPEGAAALEDQARAATAAARYGEAEDLLRKAQRIARTRQNIRQLADVLAWAGKLDESIPLYRELVEAPGATDEEFLALARALSWKKDGPSLEESLGLLDRYLARHPDDDGALLQRARVYGWLGRADGAKTDYRAYLLRRNEDAVRLELARTLSWSKDRKDVAEALVEFDRYLEHHPDAWDVVLLRARAAGWAGKSDEAIAGFRSYMEHHPEDEKALEDMAIALSQGPQPAASIPYFDYLLVRQPDNTTLAMRRARAYLWAGSTAEAEDALTQLLAQPNLSPKDRNDVEVDLARVYAQTRRRAAAMETLEAVLERDAGHEGAASEYRRQSTFFRSHVTPRWTGYFDRNDLAVTSLGVDLVAQATRQFALLTGATGYRAGSPAEILYLGKFDAGFWLNPVPSLEFEATVGPRIYPVFSPTWGTHLSVRHQPTGWFGAKAAYGFDDLFFDLLQPATITSKIRAHSLSLTPELALGPNITATGRATARWTLTENQALDATGTLSMAIVRPLWVGYNVQWLRWKYNDPAYWSPQGYAAHLGFLRVAKDFPSSGFGLDAQISAGPARERVEGFPEGPWGLAIGAGLAAAYQVSDTVGFRGALQYGQTMRQSFRDIAAGTIDNPFAQVRILESGRYYWLASHLSMTVRF